MTEAQKMQGELEQENEQLRKELDLCKQSEVTKEAAMIELRRQCQELIKSRAIECNILVNKPPPTSYYKQSNQPYQQASDGDNSPVRQKKVGKSGRHTANNLTLKGSKNLQFAKDLNEEIELMFADDDFKIKPSKNRQKRKETK